MMINSTITKLLKKNPFIKYALSTISGKVADQICTVKHYTRQLPIHKG